MVKLVDVTASPSLETKNQRSNPANCDVNFDSEKEISYQHRSRIFPSRKQEHRALPAVNLTFKSVEYSRQTLFCSTEGQSFSLIAEKLRQSLSEVLVEFNPVAAKCQASNTADRRPALCDDDLSSVDFIEASSMFTLEEAISENSVTELRGGTMAMGWATNGTGSARSFLSSWAHFCREEAICLDSIPYIIPPLPEPSYNLRSKYQRRQHLLVAGSRMRTFYFASGAVQGLKKAANAGRRIGGVEGRPFSIFHSLTAHLWMCITRARDLHPKAITGCSFPGNRASSSFNFNSVTTAGKLARRDLAFAAALLREAVAENGNVTDRQAFIAPSANNKNMVWMGKLEGAESNLNPGRPTPSAVCEGWEDGRVTVFGGGEGGGNMGAHIVLRSETMEKLENDPSFDLSSLS